MTDQPGEKSDEQPDERDGQSPGIGDEDLPEDLQPGEDNPLAEPLDPGDAPDVDLNEPSKSYEKQLAEEDDGSDQDGASDEG